MNEEKIEKIKGLSELSEAASKLEDFGNPNNWMLKKIFFDISENEDYQDSVRDIATDLMLYCEDDESVGSLSKEKILKKIATTFCMVS